MTEPAQAKILVIITAGGKSNAGKIVLSSATLE
jgi:hypothetical protein